MDQSVKEAIILAGGLGTRLKSAIGNIPKPLAPVNGKPFLHYLLIYLKEQGVTSVVLSVGYQWEMIQKHFQQSYLGINIKYAIEQEALGTGGAIRMALELIDGEICYVLNGDTYFDIDLQDLGSFHLKNKSECTLAATIRHNFDRFGTLDIAPDGTVTSFNEKQPKVEGVINGGIYCLSKSVVQSFPQKDAFSFEKEYLQNSAVTNKVSAKVYDGYFIDIGIPADYARFKKDQAEAMQITPPLADLPIDHSWTLFLDRDGVINERLVDDYVKQINELRIIEGVPEAIAQFSKQFGKILVVTNQQGIGKGMMDQEDLELIHGYMNNVFENHGGKVDHFYFAPQLASEGSGYRKPGIGMGLKAKEDFPQIDFSRSIMIGDSESDIEFGMNLGMITVMLTTVRNISTKADYIFDNLQTVAKELKKEVQ